MHEQIWAPWRLTYVASDKKTEPTAPVELLPGADPDCFLCQFAAAKDDCGGMLIERTDSVITVLNRYPYNNGHLLISPLAHVGCLTEVQPDVQSEMTRTISRMIAALKGALYPAGFNVGLNLGAAAGAGVPGHLHWHIVPRWGGDTNFMPVIAGANVIPQSLQSLQELLKDRLAEMGPSSPTVE